MHCRPGDIAFISSTHPSQRLHGLLVTCKAFMGATYGEVDVWEIDFCSGPQRDDFGVLSTWGLIQDRYLRPIRDRGDDAIDWASHRTPRSADLREDQLTRARAQLVEVTS